MTNILEAANEIIYGERADTYGSFEANAEVLAELWSMILKHPVDIAQVPLMLVALKFMRLCNDPLHRDSWLDLAGYVGCAGKIPGIWEDV